MGFLWGGTGDLAIFCKIRRNLADGVTRAIAKALSGWASGGVARRETGDGVLVLAGLSDDANDETGDGVGDEPGGGVTRSPDALLLRSTAPRIVVMLHLRQQKRESAGKRSADTFFPKDTGITLRQQVAQLKARLDVYEAHANVPSPAVNQHTCIPASMVPKPTPFDGRPKNREHFVVSINNYLGLTLSPQTPTSYKVRAIGLYLGDEPCRWFGDLIAAQPHVLEHYDAFLQAVNRNYAGTDLELEARHAYHNMRQFEVPDTMLYIQQWIQATKALLRNFEEFDRVKA
ncbi:hypothetical protein RI367_003378 [Sorochytrium milnesiophthora]